MRGVVSLAAALALPADFPFRNLILYVVFAVILGTSVVQGMSLPWLGVLTTQRHRLYELHRESIIEEALVQKLEREIDMEESRNKIDLECDLKSENVLTRQTNIS